MRGILITLSLLALAACNSPNKDESNADSQNDATAIAPAPAKTNASTAPSTPAPPPPNLTLVGKWAPIDGICAAESDSFLEVRSDGISGYEWGCEVRPRIQSSTTYEGKSICFDQTEMMDMPATSLTLKLRDNGNLVKVEDGQRTEWKRCK